MLYPRRENSIHFNQTHSKVSLDAEELTFIGDMDMLTQIGIDVLSSNIEDIMGGMDEEAEEEARESAMEVKGGVSKREKRGSRS